MNNLKKTVVGIVLLTVMGISSFLIMNANPSSGQPNCIYDPFDYDCIEGLEIDCYCFDIPPSDEVE